MIPQHIGKTSEREMNELAEESYRQITGQNPVIPQPQYCPHKIAMTACGDCNYIHSDCQYQVLKWGGEMIQKMLCGFPASRTRPAPSPSESEITNKILRMVESDEWQKEHDATIAAKARDKLFEAIRSERDPHLDYVDWDSIEAAYVRTGGEPR